jgi:hypothetical protein
VVQRTLAWSKYSQVSAEVAGEVAGEEMGREGEGRRGCGKKRVRVRVKVKIERRAEKVGCEVTMASRRRRTKRANIRAACRRLCLGEGVGLAVFERQECAAGAIERGIMARL